MKNKLIGIGLAVALFVTGAVVGTVVDRSWGHNKTVAEKTTQLRSKRHKRLLRRFRKRLKLTDAQVSSVSKILTESRTKSRSIRKQARDDIKKVLDAKQIQIYDRMLKRRRERRKRRNRRNRRGR